MKNFSPTSLRFALAAGTLAALTVLPQSASAQLVGGFMRSGATVQGQPAPVRQAVPVQQQSFPAQQFLPAQQSSPMQVHSGAIQRGGFPIYRPLPMQSNPGYGGSSVFVQRPTYSQTLNTGQQFYRHGGEYNNYNNGYSNNSGNGYNNNYSGSGPVVTVPDGAYYPTGGTLPGRAFTPPIGPANGYFNNLTPPVGPANGYFSGQAPITGGGPALLGGYYYGNYCNDGGGRHEYRSVYSGYGGFPQYIYSPNIVVVSNDYPPEYSTPSLPFFTPVYQTTYNQNNYYVATEGRVDDLQAGGERAKAALEHAYPADSFQAAFADIAHAWTDGSIDLIRKHLRDNDTRVSVFLDGKYSYSIASSDFSQITRDALDRLHTVSFDFTRLRKLKNGDVTAFGSHVYRASEAGEGADSSGTVPFDQAGTGSTDTDSSGASKTLYISYTLRRYGTEWDIVATDSANHDLAAVSQKPAE